MYFNAFLAKTLLAFSGELGIRRDAINRVCTGVRSLLFPPCPMPNAQCPMPHAQYFSTRRYPNAQYKCPMPLFADL
ncbi:hypothetical protein [Nostoc sp.]|uniref:hypothetical protein n=1 Tax=Nostoc sp. TaxID=1180 RepID=UPI002FF679A6